MLKHIDSNHTLQQLVKNNINTYKSLGIIGCILMVVANWIPFVSIMDFGIEFGKLSLIDYFVESKFGIVAYIGIACIILCGIFMVINAKRLNTLTGLLSAFSILLGVFAYNGNR